jgi:hypothetical protein
MQTDPHLYYRRLCLTNSDDNWYYRIPILSAIDPETFVSSLLQQSPENQGLIWRTFKARYEHGDLNGDLAAEKPWLEKVREKLQQQAEGMSAMGQYLMRQRVASCITHFLEA